MHRSSDTGGTPDTEPVSEEPTDGTILISPHTREQLDSLKIHSDESYDAVISRLCDQAGSDTPLGDEIMKEIEQSLSELREGISRTHEEIVQELIAEKKG